MRFVERNLWPCLALALVACSLVTDFPAPQADRGAGARDAGRDGGGGSGKTCSDHNGCSSDELCCGSKCVATGEAGCTACGVPCAGGMGGAPNCNNRMCECELDSGKGCAGGQYCEGEGRAAECVGCRTDADCAARGDKLTQCVDSQCAECDRKDPENPRDDEGCSEAKASVCNAQNVCEGCTADNQCGPGQQCVRSRGCFGCAITQTDLSKNGCTNPSAPICRAVGENGFQCGGCMTNEDCRGGFCNEPAGTCHAACDPNVVLPQTANGCETSAGKPLCKPDTGGIFSCRACTPADCAAGETCATTGPRAGACVRGPAGPADCVAPTPAFLSAENRCVECTVDAQCAASTVGKYCNQADFKCAPCGALAATAALRDTACLSKSPTTPFCHRSGLCGACKSGADCSGATPICSETATCVGCNTLTMPSPDAACTIVDDDSPRCVTGGTVVGAPVGSCATCNPGAPPGMNGCDSGNPYCGPSPSNPGVTCNDCVPGATIGTPGACLVGVCAADRGRYRCAAGLLGIPIPGLRND